MRLEDSKEGIVISTHQSHLPKTHPSTPRRNPLRAVPAPDTAEFAELIAELLADEQRATVVSASAPWKLLRSDEEALLALGLPVALPAGDDLPELVDEDSDVHEAAVVNIQTACLHRYLREMDPRDSKVIRLVWGIGCQPHTQMEAAARTGRSREAVRSALTRGMGELRVRFGAGLPDAA